MADVEELPDSRFDDIDLESILARVERRGPLLFTRKRCLYRAPEFVKRLSGEATVDEGATVRFECKIVGIPTPTVKWTKDDEEIPDDNRIKIEANENGEYSLTIDKVKKKDEAAYRIKAENAEGSSSSTIYVAVKVKSKKSRRSKRNMQHPSGFTPITEKIKEEEQEAETLQKQPDSPLTPLYSGLTRKNRTWPEFLGSWAFVNEIGNNDFDDLPDNEDYEDVFSTEGSSESDTISVNGSDVLPVSESNGNSDSDSDNEIAKLLNRNLVFENQNFTQSSKLSETNFNDDITDKEKYCNKNGQMVPGNDNSGHEEACKSVPEVSTAVCLTSRYSLSTSLGANECHRKLIFNDSQEQSLSDTSPNETGLCPVEFSSLNQYITTKNVVKVSKERCQPIDYPWLEMLFSISLFTLIALICNMKPTSFTLSIFVGHLIFFVFHYLFTEN